MKNLFLALLATVLFSGTSFGQQYLPTDDQLDALAKLSATQYFIDVNNELSEIYTAPSKRAEADEIASINNFISSGGNNHPELRLSLRDFEDKNSPSRDMDFINFDVTERLKFGLPIKGISPPNNQTSTKTSVGTLCLSVGLIVCVSWGGEVGKFADSKNYNSGLDYNENSYNESKSILIYLKDFASKNAFQSLLNELYSLPINKRQEFVKNTILDSNKLRDRGINVPNDILIQRSAFSDDRPTLFCIVKYKSDGKSKLTLTFDSES